jgi:protein tyrosine phosphatase
MNEFWIMIWDENVPVISMMTKCQEGKKQKASPYWVEQDQENSVVDVKVLSSEQTDNIVKRIIELKRNNETRLIRHLHFLGWPDFSVPSYYQPLALILKETEHCSMIAAAASETNITLNGPTVVHCSAGIGRAMTAISCLITIRKIKACLGEKVLSLNNDTMETKESVEEQQEDNNNSDSNKLLEPWWEKFGCMHDPLDVKGTVERVRRQRHGAVVNAEQYEFVHRFVLDWLSHAHSNA